MSVSVKQYKEYLAETYEVGALSEPEQKKYWLIERYRKKVSRRLLIEQEILRQKGKDDLKIIFSRILSETNPFLSYFRGKNANQSNSWNTHNPKYLTKWELP